MSNKTLWLLAISAAASAQEAQKEAPKYYDEETVQRIMKDWRLIERNKRVQTEASENFESLALLAGDIQRRFGARAPKMVPKKPLLSLDESVQNIFREDEYSKIVNDISIHIWLFDSVEDAGRAAAMHLIQRPVLYQNGSFSGMAIGDWSAKNLWGARPALLFTRRNAFVRVICQPAIEVWKRDRSMRGVDDPGVIDICEALARDIDAQIQELPAKKRE